jgi:hypothetical protein
MVVIKCKRCGYEWDYKGKSEWYAPCSRCKTSVNIKKQKIKDNHIEKKKIICTICGKNKTKFEMANEDICLDCSNNIIDGMNIFKNDEDMNY